MSSYSQWFENITSFSPRPWQATLGASEACDSRLLRIPTGLGKTLGVASAWAYHRLVRKDSSWPRRLVIALPMRVLVEQTYGALTAFFEGAARVPSSALVAPPVHLLMGGTDIAKWYLEPGQEAVLVGTQDMLLSRALNRGYGVPRGRWPMEYALLHSDCLWVMDEVQLMGVGFATSAQLQQFRQQAPAPERPSRTWWMSATLRPEWLAETTLGGAQRESLEQNLLGLSEEDKKVPIYHTSKPVELVDLPKKEDPKAKAWAELVWQRHQASVAGEWGRITLAICNTVDEARLLHKEVAALRKKHGAGDPVDLRLVHSRFRGAERAGWAQEFLNRGACTASVDRIVIATQVVEAGVDISATTLVTQLAPWPSLVQRAGRAARYGGEATVTIVDRCLGPKGVSPYEEPAMLAAKDAARELGDFSIRQLELLEDKLAQDPHKRAALYPYAPLHLLLPQDHADLFYTEADMTGADLDVSRFIREGDERDVRFFWASWEKSEPAASPVPPRSLRPRREELCPVNLREAKAWLGHKTKAPRRAFVWDYLDNGWRRLRTAELTPGMEILVEPESGGYAPDQGFVGAKSAKPVPIVPQPVGAADAPTDADAGEGLESLSFDQYKTIATHCREAGEAAQRLCGELNQPSRAAELITLAALLHDVGKAAEVFQDAIVREERPANLEARHDLAKAPQGNWQPVQAMFGKRKGFRHELMSTLALFELLARADPYHEALLGPHRQLVELGLLNATYEDAAAREPEADGVGRILASLSALEFNLVAYLVCAHHGKIRASWHSSPHDQAAALEDPESAPLRGVKEGDLLPALTIPLPGGALEEVPETEVHLDAATLGLSGRYGASWSERVASLLGEYGPEQLAYYEALVRIADQRASGLETGDPLLKGAKP